MKKIPLFGLVLFLAACQTAIEPTKIIDTTSIVITETPKIESTQGPTELPTITATSMLSSPETEEDLQTPQAEETPDQPSQTPTETSLPPAVPVTQIQLDPFASGFVRPTYLTHAFDNRLFVVEQPGRILLIEDGEIVDQPFLDIRDRVGSEGLEQGLLSVAFHPNYGENGRFFVNYTDRNGATIVASYQVTADDPNQGDPASEQVLLRIPQPYLNHNGGQIAFGPDGNLYIGMGDGGSAGDPMHQGQDPSTLLGALLRLNVEIETDYLIPADNPYFGFSSTRNEIWATGLRNPWRFSFDRLTGDLFIADVGQNLWEEVNFQTSASTGGENYGWNVLEGTHCFQEENCATSGFTLPITDYGHQEGSCSVTGGYVYRGKLYPELTGNYFFGDYCSGLIWSLFHQQDGNWLRNELLDSNLLISSFGEDVNGELYVLDQLAGDIYQLTPG